MTEHAIKRLSRESVTTPTIKRLDDEWMTTQPVEENVRVIKI